MKTTVELPDDLMRAIKVRAAEEGLSIKELLTDLLSSALSSSRKRTKPKRLRYEQMPILKGGRKAAPGKELTPERVAEILWGSGQ
jgi:plasmid stability protein